MLKKKATQVICLLMVLTMAGSALAGCDSDGAGGAEMGRYVETALYTATGRLFDAFFDGEGNLVFYVSTGRAMSRNVLREDGRVDSSEVPVVQRIFESGAMFVRDISESPDGSLLILFGDSGGANRLARSTDGVNYELIEIAGWGGAALGAMPGIRPSTQVTAPLEETQDEDDQDENGQDEETQDEEIQDEDVQENEPETGVTTQVSVGMAAFDVFGPIPNSVFAIDGGFLVQYAMGGVNHYDLNGTLIRGYIGSGGSMGGMAGRSLAVFEDYLALVSECGNEINIYDLTTGRRESTVVIDEERDDSRGTVQGQVNWDGTGVITLAGMGVVDITVGFDAEGLYIGSPDGIFRRRENNWEMVVDGSLTSLIMANITLSGLLRSGDGGFYSFLFNAGNMEVELVRFAFDPAIPAAPTMTIEIFSLHDNATVRQAIGEFQRRNPDIRVSLRIGTSGAAATTEDVIRALNTEILAGRGPDLIVMDGLPIGSFIEKGVFRDITGLAERLAGSRGLLENMSGTYAREGLVFGLPSRFSVPVMLGVEEMLVQIDSLSTLAAMVEELQGGDIDFLRPPDFLWGPTGVIMTYYNIVADSWMNPNNTINEAALEEFFANMLTIDRVLKEHTPETGGVMTFVTAVAGAGGRVAIMDMSVREIAYREAKVHLQNLTGVMGLWTISLNIGGLEDMALMSTFGEYKFFPSGGIGILSTSPHYAIAERFIETLLSPIVQDNYLMDGFPVNGESLEAMLRERLVWDNEELCDMGFLRLSHNLTTPVFVDEVIRAAVQNQARPLMEGSVTPQQAAARVVQETWIYLAE